MVFRGSISGGRLGCEVGVYYSTSGEMSFSVGEIPHCELDLPYIYRKKVPTQRLPGDDSVIRERSVQTGVHFPETAEAAFSCKKMSLGFI